MKGKVLLAGGGGAEDSLLLDKQLAEWVGPDGKMLFWPLARSDLRSFESSMAWIRETFWSLNVRNIEMWTKFADHHAAELDDYEAVFIGGGNAYWLSAQLIESGFEPYVRTNNSPQANAIYQWDGGSHSLNPEISDWSSINFCTINTQYWYSTIFKVSALNTCGTSFEYSQVLTVKENPHGGGIIPQQFQIIDNFTNLVVKPNPANEYISVEIIDENFESGINDKIHIKILNGRSIPVFTDNSYQKTFNINTSNLSNGLYMLQVIYKEEKYSKQILIVH